MPHYKSHIPFLVAVWLVLGLPSLLAQQGGMNSPEKIFGKNFSLTVDPTSGTLSYHFSESTNELESILAKRKVHLVSDLMELNCDELSYDGKTSKVKATGSPIRIIQNKISAECGVFSFDPVSGRSELLESPQIITRDEQNHKIRTKGKKIFIERQQTGDTMILIEGYAKLTSEVDEPTSPGATRSNGVKNDLFDSAFEIDTGEKGEILYAFRENDLRSIVARNEVSIVSRQLNLSCSRLEFNNEKKMFVASGKPVIITQQTLSAECGRLEYYPDDGKYLLLEDPVIMNRDREGAIVETRGEKIILLQTKGMGTSILVEGNPQFIAEAAEKEKIQGEKTEPKPIRIDENNVDQIKNLDIIQD
ncbi:hypothetical protein JW926_03900 [Candidatus Sumerlaeota bacterium]|nr:hypothetical protein [Candidatus Sumerlaeota bacterium]